MDKLIKDIFETLDIQYYELGAANIKELIEQYINGLDE
jgi:hypothetical protein